ncbi:MAG: trigger factor [Elusimicrobiota bacterium]
MEAIVRTLGAEIVLSADEATRKTYTVTLAGERLRLVEDKWTKAAQDNAKIPGFRKGQIPKDVVVTQLGSWIKEKVTQEILSSVVGDIAKHNKLKVVTSPVVSRMEYGFSEKLGFDLVFEIEPTITLGAYKGLALKRRLRDIKPEDVDAEFKRLLAEGHPYYLLPAKGPINGQDKLWVLLDLKAYPQGQPQDPAWQVDNEYLNLAEDTQPYGLRDALAGKSPGDTVTWSVDLGEDCPQESWRGKKFVFEAKVNGLKTLKEPDAGDPSAFGLDEGKTTELKDAVRNALAQRREYRERQLMKDQLIGELLNENRFDVPVGEVDARVQDLLKRAEHLFSVQGTAFTPQHQEELKIKYKIEAANDVRLAYLTREIAKRENVKVSQEDLDKRIEAAQDEQEKQYLKDHKEDALFDILTEKVFDFLIANAKVETESPAEA